MGLKKRSIEIELIETTVKTPGNQVITVNN